MRRALVVLSLFLGAGVAAGCGDGSDCGPGGCESNTGGTGAGGTGGRDATGGTGGVGAADGGGGDTVQGGTDDGQGGHDEPPDTSWSETRPASCTDEQARLATGTDLFFEVAQVGVFPKLEPGFSAEATVLGYEDDMTVIRLETDAGQFVRIRWAGVLGDYPEGSKVILEQNRDWTIIARTTGRVASAMFHRNGDIPGETLVPLPLGGPALRFAMQCNVQDDHCTMDAVELQAGDGAALQTIPSGATVQIGNWTVGNSTLMQASNCPGFVPFRSLIWAEGWQ